VRRVVASGRLIRSRGAGRVRRSGGNDDRLHDLVGQGLPLDVPEREGPADEADDRVKNVADIADEGRGDADRLAGLLADEPQAKGLPAPRTGQSARWCTSGCSPRSLWNKVNEKGEGNSAYRIGDNDKDENRRIVDKVAACPLRPVRIGSAAGVV